MTDRELFIKALDALEWNLPVIQDYGDKEQLNIQHNAINALRGRAEQLKPLRPWVGLTKEEAKEISLANRPYVIDMIAALEARLKEKNT
jgi:hypothetical protein